MLTVFGAITIDLIFPVDSLPVVGETVWSENGRMISGGKAAVQAMAVARDGARVALVGAVGEDPLAQIALAGPAAAGVDTRGVMRVPVATGRSAICVEPDGHALVVTDRGANVLARAAQVSDAALGRGQTLLLQLDTDPAECAALILRARRAGTRIVLNVSPRRFIDADALRAVDLIVGNSDDIAWLGERIGTGNNPASIHAALGVPTVRMRGVQGAEMTSEEGWLHMPSLPVRMRDTTYAGDCFVGVLTAALARRASFAVALRRAAVAAGLSAERLGGGDVLPRAAEIDAALAQAPHPTSHQDQVPD